jgi:hypothetical protein
MKSLIKKLTVGLMIVPALALSVGLAAPVAVSAACDDATTGGLGAALDPACAKGEGQRTELFGENGVITSILNFMLFIVGILAVIMLIFGGIRYVTSTGDQTRVTAAKNTIMYAIIGLVVAILGYALVTWVTSLLAEQ